jgi:hypothetical protein
MTFFFALFFKVNELRRPREINSTGKAVAYKTHFENT